MAELREIPCSICGSLRKRLVGKPMYIAPEARRIISRCSDIRIVQCEKCSFYYTAPMPFWNDNDLDILYSAEYFPQYTFWWMTQRKADAHHRLHLLSQAANRADLVFLDVGCGYGHVLERAVELGWKVYGLEPSSALAIQARERIGNRATIHVESLEKATFPSGFLMPFTWI